MVTHVDAKVQLGQEEWQQFRKDKMTLQEQVDNFRALIYVGGSKQALSGAVTCVVLAPALQAPAHKPAGRLMGHSSFLAALPRMANAFDSHP